MKFYKLTHRGREITSEVICDEHYQQSSDEGRDMAPLSVREQGAGYKQLVTEYEGDRPCATCSELAERRKGSAA